MAAGLARQDRVVVYADKSVELITALFGTSRTGGVMVPINPLLKAEQVGYILRDCNVAVLVTTRARLTALAGVLAECPDLRHLVVLGERASAEAAFCHTGTWSPERTASRATWRTSRAIGSWQSCPCRSTTDSHS